MGKNIKGKVKVAFGASLLMLTLGACGNTAPEVTATAPAGAAAGESQGPGYQTREGAFTLDLRQTPLAGLTDEQKAKLTAPGSVIVTLSNGQEFAYANVDGAMLVDGDTALNRSGKAVQELERLDAQAASTSLSGQSISIFPQNGDNWGSTIAYYWNPGEFTAEQEAALNRGIARWNEQIGQTVTWVRNPNARNAVRFIRGDAGSCGWSYLGSLGGHQELSISCFGNGTIIHEMGHASGLHHEHTRCDRDNYVAIPAQFLGDSNFARNCNAYTYGPYDYDSVMNYGQPYAYPRTPQGQYTGTPSNLGRMNQLSPADIRTLQLTFTGSTGPVEPTDPTNPTPTDPGTPTYDRTYTGTLGTNGYSTYTTDYFQYAGGTLRGTLTGPASADFELYLQRWNGSSWVRVAASESPTSSESVSYSASSGYYRWVVFAYSGGGNFTLGENR